MTRKPDGTEPKRPEVDDLEPVSPDAIEKVRGGAMSSIDPCWIEPVTPAALYRPGRQKPGAL